MNGVADDYKKALNRTVTGVKGYYKRSTSKTSSYLQRFTAFLLFTQVNVLLWYILFAILLRINETIAPVTVAGGAIVQIFFIISFLFKGIKARAATYILCGISYLIITVIIFKFIGFYLSLDGIVFFSILGLWNGACGAIILVIGLIRTFMLGVKHDYVNDNSTKEN